jgi:hypothetical protein
MNDMLAGAFGVALLVAWAVAVHRNRTRRRDIVRGNAWRPRRRSGWPWRSEEERNFWLWILFG